MIKLLAKFFIKDRDNVTDPAVRRAYGALCGITGVCLNVLLFAFKYLAGTMSGSIAVTADAFNNLSDAGSSLITLIGFRLAGRKPDKEHPYGHGRAEYIAGMAVSAVILMMGFDLLKTSVLKVFSPEPVSVTLLPMIVLAVSVLVKLGMYAYNSATAKRIGSAAMKATATDSISDAVATTVVLLCMLLTRFAGVQIDGFAGVAVSLFILYAGGSAGLDTMKPLLGQAPDPEFVKRIEETCLSHENVVGVHDLMVHDYGPGRVIVSLHAEVPETGDINVLHDDVDLLENQLGDELGCIAVIHMDPISTDDSAVAEVRRRVTELVKELDHRLMIHDFRMVSGPTHTNLVFDVVVPQPFEMTDSEVKAELDRLVHREWENYFAVVKVDKSYV